MGRRRNACGLFFVISRHVQWEFPADIAWKNQIKFSCAAGEQECANHRRGAPKKAEAFFRQSPALVDFCFSREPHFLYTYRFRELPQIVAKRGARAPPRA